MKIYKLAPSDLDKFQQLIDVFEDVFEINDLKIPDASHLQRVLNQENFFVFVALSGDVVVGGLTAHKLLQYYTELPLVYLYDLAVRTSFQRQGIGRMLISGLTDYCRETGVEEMYVQADEEDVEALEFYRATGGTRKEVVHFNYPLNDR